MKKNNFKKSLCGLFLFICVLSVAVSCNRSEYKPESLEQADPNVVSIGVQIADTEFADGTSSGLLATDIKYRAIVYREDGSYFWHNDYVTGRSTNRNFSFNKKNDEKYTVVVYSYNSTKRLPAITDIEMGNIRSAVLDFDLTQGELMYMKVENYKPSKSENIKVKLRHRFVPFTLTFDNSSSPSDFYKIERVEYAKISNNKKGKISLLDGEVTERRDPHEQNLLFSVNAIELGEKVTSTVAWLNVERTANLIYKLKSDLSSKIGVNFGIKEDKEKAKIFKDKEIIKSVSLEKGKLDEVITKQKCGAWISDTEFLEFMCQNLGATSTSFDFMANLGHTNVERRAYEHPSVKREALGAKYHWGEKELILTEEDEKKLDAKEINWTDRVDITRASNDLTWKGSSKTTSDPCPNGYRIPRAEEISSLYNYNKELSEDVSKIGMRDFSRTYEGRGGTTDNVSAIGFGYFLLLQSNGCRNLPGQLRDEDLGIINIAVASGAGDMSNARNARIKISLGGQGLQIIENGTVNNYINYALTVRCVKE